MEPTRPLSKPSAERRFAELAAAVREHEQALRRSTPLGRRAPDENLYRRLRQICGQ
jgi:hypothetical protein